MNIPKIIHHSAPEDENSWHPIWRPCYESWKKHFKEPEYAYLRWNDNDIDNLIKNYYPKYWDCYKSFPLHIIKIDFARFAILHSCGGIYADMDMFCYKNFYNELDCETSIVASKCRGEILQNSLMISSKDNDFMFLCMDECVNNFYNIDINSNIGDYVKDISGPYHVAKCYNMYLEKIKLLDIDRFNPPLHKYDENIVTKHMLSGLWGKEVIELANQIKKEKSFSEIFIADYLERRDIDLNNFDFYKNY